MSRKPEITLAQFVKQRLEELKGQRTRSDIAKDAGFDSDKTLAGIESGRIHLPIDRAVRLADAIDVDQRDFLLLALSQFLPAEIVDLIGTDPSIYSEGTELRATVVALEVQVATAGAVARKAAANALEIIEHAASIEARTADAMKGLREMTEKYY